MKIFRKNKDSTDKNIYAQEPKAEIWTLLRVSWS